MIQAYGSAIYCSKAEKVGSNTNVTDLISQLQQVQGKLKHPLVSAKHLNLNLAVFSIDLGFVKRNEDHFKGVFINPEIIKTNAPLVSGLEDDLSLPRLALSIERPKQIEVSFLNVELMEQKATFSDLSARWIQHGIDQLDGISVIERLNTHRKRSVKGHLRKLEEQKIDTNYKLQYDN